MLVMTAPAWSSMHQACSPAPATMMYGVVSAWPQPGALRVC
jgi:hypothetical protein